METYLPPRVHQARLRAELVARGWTVTCGGTEEQPTLWVCNPEQHSMSDRLTIRCGLVHWSWGPVVTQASDVSRVADRVMHVLRKVQS